MGSGQDVPSHASDAKDAVAGCMCSCPLAPVLPSQRLDLCLLRSTFVLDS